MQAAATAALHSLMFNNPPFPKKTKYGSHGDDQMLMQTFGPDRFHGQWGPGPVPKLTPFTYWNRKWEVKVSTHAFMGWGLFALGVAKVGDELLPFVGQWFSQTEFKSMCNTNPQFIKYALRLKKNVYQDGNVLNGNIAGYINSSIGREEEANVQWDYVSLPAPWNPKVWGYAMTVATRDIAEGDELFTYYPLN